MATGVRPARLAPDPDEGIAGLVPASPRPRSPGPGGPRRRWLALLSALVLTLGAIPAARAVEGAQEGAEQSLAAERLARAEALAARRASLDLRLKREVQGWAVAAAVTGAAGLGTLAVLPFRLDHSGEAALALTIAWAPALAGLATIAAVRNECRLVRPSRIRGRLNAMAWTFAGAATAFWTLTVARTFVILLIGYESPPAMFPFAAAASSFSVAAVMTGSLADECSRHLRPPVASLRRPAPRVAGIAPGAMVVEF